MGLGGNEEEENEHIQKAPFCHTQLTDFYLASVQFKSIAFVCNGAFPITSYHPLPETPPPNFS